VRGDGGRMFFVEIEGPRLLDSDGKWTDQRTEQFLYQAATEMLDKAEGKAPDSP
jgi:hypothetical protein